MQKMLTSVDAWPKPLVMFPAGAPVSLIVCAPPPAGPNAPLFRCWQSGHVPLPAVLHCAADVHGMTVCGSQLPVPAPVQHGNGTPAAAHPELCGQFGSGSPEKHPVPAALMGRQNPQNTWFCPLRAWAVTCVLPVVRLKAIGRPPMLFSAGGGQSCVVGNPAFTAVSAGVHGIPSFAPP